jgi:hypothetical protein
MPLETLNFLLYSINVFITSFLYYAIGKIIFFKSSKKNITEICILGMIIMSFLAVLLNFAIPLNKINNSIIIFFIILVFFFIFKNISLKELKNIFFISLLSILIVIFDTVNRPDAFLYHLPYSQILNENKTIIGLSNLHFRFGHVSIMQYLSSVNFTFLSGKNGILIPSSVLWSSIFIYFLNDSLKMLKNKEYNFNQIFSLIIFMFICFRINRYSEFGNDALGHLCFFYLISIFLKNNIKDLKSLHEIILISIFIFLNKTFLVFVFFIPIYLIIKLKINIFKLIISWPSLLLFIWLLKNIFVSGCLIYPISYTCIKSLPWTNTEDIIKQNIKGEAWAKGWVDRNKKEFTKYNSKTMNQKEYIKKMNWFNTWKKKNADVFIKNIVVLLIILTLILFIKKKQIHQKKDRENILFATILCLIGTITFMLKFPIYRYGFSYLVVLLSLFFILSIQVNIKRFNSVKFIKFLLAFSLILLFLKQAQRILNKYDERSILPNITYSKKFDKKYLSKDFYIYYSITECGYSKAPCSNYKSKLIHRLYFNYNAILHDSFK